MKVGTTACVIALAAAPALAAPMKGPEPEVAKDVAKVELPPVPDFAIAPSTDDVHDVKELLAMGPAYFGTDVKVRGYVIWAYDCVGAIRKPGESKAAAQQRIDEDMTLCERAKFYLGSEKTTPLEHALWVVDVPRPPYKMEKDRLPKEQLDGWPAVPKIKVGDYVTIRGHFDQKSPHKEHNSDGLLMFASVTPARPGRSTKPVPMPLRAPAAPPTVPTAPAERPVAQGVRADSIRALNDGNALFSQRQFKEALAKYDEALKLWPDNHLAAYGAALVWLSTQQAATAKTYLDRAVALAPDQAMYQLWDGVAAYEAKVDANRKAQGTDDPDLSKADFSEAREHLELALAIEPNLWRGHYYLGRTWRAQGAARDAAGEFTKAIASQPTEWGPFVALSDLYRKWDYRDLAIKVAELGTRNVRDHTADLFYVAGLAHEDKGENAKAIDAYNLALAANAHHANALYHRGHAYFATKDYAKAKVDLEAFMQEPNAAAGFAGTEANKMLAAIADKK